MLYKCHVENTFSMVEYHFAENNLDVKNDLFSVRRTSYRRNMFDISWVLTPTLYLRKYLGFIHIFLLDNID